MAHIGLPNGKHCSVASYVASWKRLKAIPDDVTVSGWDWYPVSAGIIRRELMRGLHDRINRRDPRYGRGRRWQDLYQIALRRDARRVSQYAAHRIVEPIRSLGDG